ncbi:MAG: [FeFe] hydrogenase H-cluster radical SAM maturase HydE, partial [Lachnospiraceae bacterium]|nr:[FeFe] hydrogenase H-cluster radical SAM maturase HydE [Lachnospiraceae bacterium]
MEKRVSELIYRLDAGQSLSREEYEELINGSDPESAGLLAALATKKREAVFGNVVYTRGLIEISSICKNNCLYCGIRRDNKEAERYRLTREQILDCADEGYELGFRTFVLQGGEDPYFSDEVLCDIVSELKKKHNDCLVTLSMGERSRSSYQALYDAGADRYLLRHETADKEHYEKLHPEEMSFDNRMRCLKDLK